MMGENTETISSTPGQSPARGREDDPVEAGSGAGLAGGPGHLMLNDSDDSLQSGFVKCLVNIMNKVCKLQNNFQLHIGGKRSD